MDQDFETYGGIVVPAAALRREQSRVKYGTLVDLPDTELAEPDELERVEYKEMWWPILRLPQQRWIGVPSAPWISTVTGRSPTACCERSSS
jgi:hypothetical protein